MIYIYLKTVPVSKRQVYVVSIGLGVESDYGFSEEHFNIRPTRSVSKKQLAGSGIDKAHFLQAPPFCDVANELIEIIGTQRVSFLSHFHYRLFESEFKTIGYNCNLNYQTLESTCHALKISAAETEASQLLKRLSPAELQPFENASQVAYLQQCYTILEAEKAATAPEASPQADFLASLTLDTSLLYKPGVYYFKNDRDEVIYVGKAKRVKDRLQSHFRNAGLGEHTMYKEVVSVDVQYTGSDLIAQLLESQEIKQIRPKFNTQQVKTPAPYQIIIKTNKRGIKRFALEKKTYQDTEGERYFNRNSAKIRLKELCEEYDLCPKFCAIERTAGACTDFSKGKCAGVCAGQEAVSVYNDRVLMAYKKLEEASEHKIIKLPGRNLDEVGFVLLTNGIYQGFGFYNEEDKINTINDLEVFLQRYPNNYDTNRIIATLLKKTPKDRIFDVSSGF